MSDDRDEDLPDEHAEPEPGAHERAEAEALAAALDGQPHAQEPPDDALAAALLMRHGGPRGELSAERSEAILSELLSVAPARARLDGEAKTAVPAGRPRPGKVVRLLPWAAALTAAAASALLMWRVQPRTDHASDHASAPATAPSNAAPAAQGSQLPSVPRVTVGLLSAQSAWLRAGLERDRASATVPSAREREAQVRFENELRGYRVDLLRALHGAYPSKLGQHAPNDGVDGAAARAHLAQPARGRRSR